MTFARTSLALCIVGSLLSGCASFGCAGWDQLGPMKLSRKDTGLTKKQGGQINEFGRRQGCWK